jgi:hypothetical protein
MKRCLTVIAFLGFLTSYSFVLAAEGEDQRFDPKPVKSEPEIVKWVGNVKDEVVDHTTEHKHALKFVKKGDNEEFDIVDSPELVKLHHETEKNYLMEIEAEKTPRFLFWGGSLIVKKYKVLEETASIPHFDSIERASGIRKFRDGRL